MYRRKKWKREPQAEKWTLKVFARNCEGTEQLRRYNVIRGASVGEKGILYENNTDNPEYSGKES